MTIATIIISVASIVIALLSVYWARQARRDYREAAQLMRENDRVNP
jgi:hypothetical protein